jgi:hypothetical protein
MAERLRIAENRLACLRVVLTHLVAGGKPDFELRVPGEMHEHWLRLYDAKEGHGGVVFVVGVKDGRLITFGAVYLEDVAHRPPSHPLDAGYRHLMVMRDQAFDGEAGRLVVRGRLAVRITKAQYEEQTRNCDRQYSCTMAAVMALANGREADAEAMVRLSGGNEYYMRMFEATEGHGGVVLVRFRCAGQEDEWSTHYLNGLNTLSPLDRDQAGLSMGYRRLVVERDRLVAEFEAKEEQKGREPAGGRD